MSDNKFNPLGSIAWLLREAWKVNKRLHGDDVASTISKVWERADICVKEGNDKHYPKLVDEGTNGPNQVYYYSLPMGMKYSAITKNIDAIACYLKSEVLPKFLENHPTAHFSLTILSGHLHDFIKADLGRIMDELQSKGKGMWIPIGYSRRGLECINLANDNTCHLMIGGSIGGGKSTLQRLIMVIAHIRHTPDELIIWACDFKHGNEMKTLGKDPRLFKRKISQPDQAEDFFLELYAESERRYELFNTASVTNIGEYNVTAKKTLPHIILLIDELGKLEGKEFKKARVILRHIAGDGRAAGVHVIFACHRPTADIVDGALKNNMQVTVGFRCNPVSARVLFGEDEWEISQQIDAEIAGRAVFIYTDPVLIQVPWLSVEDTKAIMLDYQKSESTSSTPPRVVQSA